MNDPRIPARVFGVAEYDVSMYGIIKGDEPPDTLKLPVHINPLSPPSTLPLAKTITPEVLLPPACILAVQRPSIGVLITLFYIGN